MDAGKILKEARSWVEKKYPFLSPEDVDDFVQSVCLDRLKSGKKRAYEYLAIDFLRKRKNTSLRGSKDALAFKTRLDNDSIILEKPEIKEPDYWEKKLKIDDDTPIVFRILLLLIYKWGMTGEDIAEILGLTPGRVSQLFKEALSHQHLGDRYLKKSGLSKKIKRELCSKGGKNEL